MPKQKMTMPMMGESDSEVVISRLTKKPGERVRFDEVLAEAETDKMCVAVVSSYEGVLVSWLVAEGDVVLVGAAIAEIEDGVAVAPATALLVAMVPESQAAPAVAPPPVEETVSLEALRQAALTIYQQRFGPLPESSLRQVFQTIDGPRLLASLPLLATGAQHEVILQLLSIP